MVFAPFFEAGLIEVFHLQSFLKDKTPSVGMDVLKLMVATPKQSLPIARVLLKKLYDGNEVPKEQNLAKLIETIILCKFPTLSREEVAQMLDIDFDVTKTVFYKEAYSDGLYEGEAEERRAFAENLIEFLIDRFGALSEIDQNHIFSADRDTLKYYYKSAWKAQTLADVFV